MARRRRRYQRIPLQPASSGGSSASTSSTSSINSSGSTGSTCNAGNTAGSGMSSGKRLAKRSIIGTRVCAPGDDGKYYSGVISAVNTPTSPQQPELNGLTITPNTRYSVRFDPVAPRGSPPSSRTEFYDQDLIGPGFGSVTGAKLVSGQKVYLTHNGREIHAEVIHHHEEEEEVLVAFKPSGHEELVNLTKRIEELRLLESRKSARLAEFDTDFARLADMGSDRKRASSHSIDMPQIVGTRKRRPSTSSESWAHTARSEGCMDECAAAMVLMSLSTPPKTNYQDSYGYWDMHNGSTRATVSSPGAGTSSGSSSASWRTGTPSPQFSDEGPCTSWAHANNMSNHTITSGEYINSNPNHHSDNMVNHTHHLNQMNQAHNQRFYPYPQRGSSSSSPNFSPFDEGIVPDIDLYRPRKKKVRSARKTRSRIEPEGNSSPWDSSSDDDDEDNDRKIYRCTWRYEDNRICTERSVQWSTIAAHVLNTHLKGKKTHDHEEDFYIVDELIEPTCSPPTKSHWDMVRPRTEDPEYQRQLLAAIPQLENLQLPTHVEGQDAVINQPYAMADVAGPSRATGSRQTTNPYDNNGEGGNGTVTRLPGTRRVRGDTKKCRKIYGMENRDLWCTQCKWKKACSRFSD